MSGTAGRLAVVTGGTDGVGREIALGLARTGCSVIVVGRDPEKGAHAERAIRVATGRSDAWFLRADLGEMRAVDRLADEVASRGIPICYLVHSAGVVRGRRILTSEGIESNFAINYLARFSLTRRLLPLLEAAGDHNRAARVVVISGAARGGKLHFEDVNLTRRFTTLGAVAQFCQANDVFTAECARRLTGSPAGDRVTITCLKLGVVRTNIRREFPWWMKVLVPLVMDPLLGQSPKEAAASALDLLLDEKYEGLSGALFLKIRRFRRCMPSSDAADAGVGERLWDLSERLLNEATAATGAAHEISWRQGSLPRPGHP